MMKKTTATALFLLAGAGAFASGGTAVLIQDSTEITIQTKHLENSADTVFQSQILSNPLLSYQNLVYKRRLDSIQGAVPLAYNEHVQNYIDLYVFKRKAQIGKMLGLSEYYFPIFERSLKEVGMPDELKFITIVESALNPQAVSRSGAVGPWQFMYATAKGYGLVMDNYVDERKDPVKASHAAAVYLKDAYNRIGDWLLTIAAYNCGTGAVTRAIARSGGEADFWKVRPYLPVETQNYVPAFIATVYAMNYYQKHDIVPQVASFNIKTDVLDVNKIVSLADVAKAADLNFNELVILNPAYKKKIINGSEANPKRLVIPTTGYQAFAALYDVLNTQRSPDEQKMIAVNNNIHGNNLGVPTIHKVKPGQTLLMVANQYGIEVQDIKVYNNLKSTQLVAGQTLNLKTQKPAAARPKVPEYVTYIVKAGDTLSEIADKFSGATVTKIKALNGLKKNTVQVGMKLKINKG